MKKKIFLQEMSKQCRNVKAKPWPHISGPRSSIVNLRSSVPFCGLFSQVLRLSSWILVSRSWVLGSRSWVLGYKSRVFGLGPFSNYYKMWEVIQSVAVIARRNRKLLQSVAGIRKCGRKLLQSVTDIAKCDKMLLESVEGIKKCGSYYIARPNTLLEDAANQFKKVIT